MPTQFYVYIVSNESRTLYIGVTNNLERRISEHKRKLVPGFTARYNVSKLVYYANFPSAEEAITYEKTLKGWLRAKKIALIEQENPKWSDLATGWDK
ncbi:GIY-YIG nuclease family protein [bacterium]|nr:MAG: GIY-YIG nuclease family protein [bacterium]